MQLALLSREIIYTYLVTQFFASCSQHSQLFVNLQDIDSLSIDSHTFIITCRYIYAISLLRGLQNSILRLIRLCCTFFTIMSQLISFVFLLFIYTQQYQISILDGSKYLSVETPGSLDSYKPLAQNNHSLSISLWNDSCTFFPAHGFGLCKFVVFI